MLLRIVAILIVFTPLANAAPVPKGPTTTAEKLVGKWELTLSRGKAPTQKHYATFDKDGTMTLQVGTGDAAVTYKGKYKTGDDTIDYELAMDGGKKGEVLKIKSFDKDELKVTDPEGIEEEFKRVTEK